MENKFLPCVVQAEFGIVLLNELAKQSTERSSLVVSPFSLMNVLAMARVGARGKTSEEFDALFGTSFLLN